MKKVTNRASADVSRKPHLQLSQQVLPNHTLATPCYDPVNLRPLTCHACNRLFTALNPTSSLLLLLWLLLLLLLLLRLRLRLRLLLWLLLLLRLLLWLLLLLLV